MIKSKEYSGETRPVSRLYENKNDRNTIRMIAHNNVLYNKTQTQRNSFSFSFFSVVKTTFVFTKETETLLNYNSVNQL